MNSTYRKKIVMKILVNYFSTGVNALKWLFTGKALPAICMLAALFMHTSLSAQNDVLLKGRIISDKGEPVFSASIAVKGTSRGTTSDTAGRFQVSVPANAVLVVTSIGFTPKEVEVNGATNLEIVLASATPKDISEVVVVGYGARKKSDLTGSVASANLEAFREAPNTNIVQSLQGTVPGLNIGQVNSAGSTPSIQIRGATTINGNTNVLIVLDGIIFNGTLSAINPDDIASIDVLKDASSTAVYGAQAANGVLLITTRKGRHSDKARIAFSSSYATQTPTVDLRPLNREEFLQKVRDLNYTSAYLAPDYRTPNPDFKLEDYMDRTMVDDQGNIVSTDFNWWDAATKRGAVQDYQLSISGGNEKTTYLVSGGYTKQAGFIINDKFSRKSVRVNLETQPRDWWKLGVQSFAAFNNLDGAEPEMRGIVRHSPLLNPYDSTGRLIPFPTGTILPSPFLTYDVDDYERNNTFFANFYSEIDVPFIKGLTYRINFGNNYRIEKHFQASEWGAGQTGGAYKDEAAYYDYTFDNILTYNRVFNQKHDLSVTGLISAIERQYSRTLAEASGFSRLTLGYNSLEQGENQFTSSDAWKESLYAQMARVNYKYDDRYLLTATVRRDGFSGFALNEKYGIFPSAALGWIISGEPFFKPKWVDFLKLRAGYGANGNLTSRYSSLSTMVPGVAYIFGDGGTTLFGQQVQTLANPDLKWETTRGVNVGLDFTLFKSRLSGNIDYYNNTTHDLLFDVALPTVTGFETIRTNVGSVKNAGIELTLQSRNIQSKDFNWGTTFNISANRNKIVRLVGLDANKDGVEDDLVASGLFIGESIRTIYDLQTDGIYQLGDDIPAGYYPGTYRLVDHSGDGNVTRLDDRVILGREEPAYRFSLLNTFDYKGFTLRIFINSVQGGKDSYLGSNYNNIGSVKDDNSIRLSYFSEIDYWSPSNPGAEYPRSAVGPALAPSSVYRDRSFIRLQDISLSYRFNSRITQALKAENLSIFVSGKNLATWTKWKGWDPETGQGLTDSGRPVMKSVSAGVNLTF